MLARMDPAYRPFFTHVWAFCWPWLWCNLAWLTAWRKRTGRRVFISVDKYGNIYIRIIGDAPKPDGHYHYEPPEVPCWQRPSLATDLPFGLDPFTWSNSGPFIAHFRSMTGPRAAQTTPVRAPP